ncbi:MAG: leucyl/phenylalanyl-tRNA--protein transferase [Methylococcaceae bacterium]|jgi:leucyl/phenylalanyl-tRNA--protein transferase
MQLTLLDPYNPQQSFPPLSYALEEPNGLIAIGGCLSPARLLNAYRHGIFPWYNPGEPILWWSPNPRLVMYPDKIRISHSLAKTLRKQLFNITFDQAFSEVISACAQTRISTGGTWISPEIHHAYTKLHELGIAHSVEAWNNGKLVGGLYGIALGQIFFGESMFHSQTNASKVAYATLVERLRLWGYQLIDCQVHTQHLASLGAEEIERDHFIRLLDNYYNQSVQATAWSNL